jgi:hypothetical protein
MRLGSLVVPLLLAALQKISGQARELAPFGRPTWSRGFRGLVVHAASAGSP